MNGINKIKKIDIEVRREFYSLGWDDIIDFSVHQDVRKKIHPERRGFRLIDRAKFLIILSIVDDLLEKRDANAQKNI